MLPIASSELAPSGSRKGLGITAWILQIAAAAAFLAAGGSKLAGAAQMVEVFEKVGIGQWFRLVTGFLEVAGAIALLVPRTAFYGASLLVVVMAAAVVTHLTVLGGSPAPAAVLLLVTGTIAYLRKPR